MNFSSLFSVLLASFLGYVDIYSATPNQTQGIERLTFTDDSYLLGNLVGLTKEKKLQWIHHSARTPLEFNFSAVQSIILNRTFERKLPSATKLLLEIHFRNGDFLRGNLLKLEQDTLYFSTDFSDSLTVGIDEITHIVFLPKSHEIIFDSFTDFKKWKKNSSKSWSHEQGDLTSIFSGSTGTTLPKLDTLAITFKAKWERSFYLALRFFSDSDGGNYGNTGYHLSFSNHRINLQSNKTSNGRTVRETLGSILVNELAGVKTANFQIFANRISKEFIVKINGTEYARWRDPDPEYMPQENGILFINQGGNSSIRLQNLCISGWQGDYSPHPIRLPEKATSKSIIYFKNGDATSVDQIHANDQNITIQTKHGLLKFPHTRVQRINFRSAHESNSTELKILAKEYIPKDQIFLERNKGKFCFSISKIEDNQIHGFHSYLGNISMPLYLVKKLEGNLGMNFAKEHLDLLDAAHLSIQEQNPHRALSFLGKTRPSLRGWYFKRLTFLAKNLGMEESNRFQLKSAANQVNGTWLDLNQSILTFDPTLHFSIWKNMQEVHSEKIKSDSYPEFKRNENESLRLVEITNDFWLAETEITHAQFQSITGKNLDDNASPQLPVKVNWQEAKSFCDVLNANNPLPGGLSWRLPTEAEWEYSCRAGERGPYHQTGIDSLKPNPASYQKHLANYGWFDLNSNNQLHQVALKKSNAWGFFDMHGNAAEWCADAASQNKISLINDQKPKQINPLSEAGLWRVLRGGSFNSSFDQCRSGYRDANDPSKNKFNAGFRVAIGSNQKGKGNKNKTKLADVINKFSDSHVKMIKVKAGTFLQGTQDQEYLADVTASQNGEYILYSSPGKILNKFSITDNSSNAIFSASSNIVEIAITNDSTTAFIGCANGSVYTFDLLKNKVLSQMHDHTEAVLAIAIDPTDSLLATTSLDGKVILKNLKNLKKIWELTGVDTHESFEFMDFDKKSKFILTSGKYCPVQLLDVSTGKSKLVAETQNNLCLKARWHPTGRFILVLQPGGMIKQIETKKQILYRTIDFKLPNIEDFEISSQGNQIFLSTKEGLCVVRKFPTDDSIIIIHPDEKVEMSPDYYFKLSNQTDTPMEQKLPAFISQNRKEQKQDDAIGKSPDGLWVVTALDGKLRIWAQRTKSYFKTLGGNMISPFSKCTFSNCGKFIRSELKSGHILIYPTETNTESYLKERGVVKFHLDKR